MSNTSLRQYALSVAKSHFPGEAKELLAEAEALYNWLIEKDESPEVHLVRIDAADLPADVQERIKAIEDLIARKMHEDRVQAAAAREAEGIFASRRRAQKDGVQAAEAPADNAVSLLEKPVWVKKKNGSIWNETIKSYHVAPDADRCYLTSTGHILWGKDLGVTWALTLDGFQGTAEPQVRIPKEGESVRIVYGPDCLRAGQCDIMRVSDVRKDKFTVSTKDHCYTRHIRDHGDTWCFRGEQFNFEKEAKVGAESRTTSFAPYNDGSTRTPCSFPPQDLKEPVQLDSSPRIPEIKPGFLVYHDRRQYVVYSVWGSGAGGVLVIPTNGGVCLQLSFHEYGKSWCAWDDTSSPETRAVDEYVRNTAEYDASKDDSQGSAAEQPAPVRKPVFGDMLVNKEGTRGVVIRTGHCACEVALESRFWMIDYAFIGPGKEWDYEKP